MESIHKMSIESLLGLAQSWTLGVRGGAGGVEGCGKYVFSLQEAQKSGQHWGRTRFTELIRTHARLGKYFKRGEHKLHQEQKTNSYVCMGL